MQLQKLKETAVFDVLVIGGGATGCGVALDAVTRGGFQTSCSRTGFLACYLQSANVKFL